MLDKFHFALVWVVEDIINRNPAGIRWCPDYLQLFTKKQQKNIYKLKEIKNKEKKVSCRAAVSILSEYFYRDWFFELNKESTLLGNNILTK